MLPLYFFSSSLSGGVDTADDDDDGNDGQDNGDDGDAADIESEARAGEGDFVVQAEEADALNQA